ncbi:MAG: polyprenol phosphomannose-dependent alpha 1,6 mannosyltransferase MptB [Streptosporangiaceae bacterium]
MSQRPALMRRPEYAGRAGRAGLVATGISVALTFVVAVAGTSVMEPPYPGRPGQPPWAFNAHLSPYLAIALAGGALAAGTIGLALTIGAMRRGWVIPARPVLLAGLVAAILLTLVPPIGSSDPLSYAAYGRVLVTGHNPYAIGPDVLARLGDPVARAVQDWYTTPSDYGTVATGGQALASLVGGTSARLTVFALSVLNLAAFAGTGLLLHRLARGDRSRQIRAAVLWTCNPLLLQVLVAGEHIDSQAVFFGVAAVAMFSRTAYGPAWRAALAAAAAGALTGLGFAIKVTIALAGAGLAVAAVQAFRRPAAVTDRPAPGSPRLRLAAVAGGLAAGFAVVAGAALAIGGPDGFRQTVRASSMVSIGSPWRVIRSVAHLAAGEAAAGDMVRVSAVVLAAVLAVLLLRGLPAGSWPGLPESVGPGDPAAGGGPGAPASAGPALAGLAGRAVFAFALAWLLAWPYVLPWYDAFAWALLPLVAASSLDWVLLARTAALAFGYLPARSAGVVIPAGLGWLQSVVRAGVTPGILAIVTIWVGVRMWRDRRPSSGPDAGPDGAASGPSASPTRQPAADGRATG